MTHSPTEGESSPCTCLNLRRAALALTALYDRHLEPAGLSLAQFSLLRHLQRLAPANVSELAEAMRLDRTTLVRNLKPLEDQGLVLDQAPRRTRERRLGLTEAGRAKYRQAVDRWRGAQAAVADALGDEALARLTRLLRQLETLKP